MKAMEVTVAGIKCDAEGCDFLDKDVSYEDYENWVNKPCPQCGANLLTEADYQFTKMMFAMSDIVNEVFPPESIPEDEKHVHTEIKLDGSGVPTNLDELIDKARDGKGNEG